MALSTHLPLISESPGEILPLGQELRFKTPHRVDAGGLLVGRLFPGNRAQHGINRETLGVIDIFIPRKTAVDGLAQQSRHSMLDVTAATLVPIKP